jgi:hypothetical protein
LIKERIMKKAIFRRLLGAFFLIPPLVIATSLTIGNAIIPSLGGKSIFPVSATTGVYIMIASFHLIPLGIGLWGN